MSDKSDNESEDKYMRKKHRKHKKHKSTKLPDELFPIPNKDKKFQEEWYPGRNLLNFPHSFRCVITARPNTGKTSIIKHILVRQDPMFQKIYVVHIDPDTKDYKDVDDVKLLNEIPSPRDPILNRKEKNLLILDDLEFKFMNKQQLQNLDRLFAYVSSHKNTSVCVIAQDPYNIPPCIRRMCNIWILGKINNDITSFLSIAQRCGLSQEEFMHIFNKYITGDHDTFWIDRTKNTPAEYRINGYKVLDKHTWELKQ